MFTSHNETTRVCNDTSGVDLFRHIPYTPNIRTQAPRISKEEWQKYEARMRELHSQNYTSKRARQILRDESQASNGCFNPSAAQYASQLKMLGLKKYNTKECNSRTETCPSNNLDDEDISSEEECLLDRDDNQNRDGSGALSTKTLQSIPKGQHISTTSLASAVDSTINLGSMPREEISSDDIHIGDQISPQSTSVTLGLSENIPLNAISTPSPTYPVTDPFEVMNDITDTGSLLTHVVTLDPDLAYEPTSAVLKLWDGSVWGTTSFPARDDNEINEVSEIADCLYAAGLYADAFDLYYTVFRYLVLWKHSGRRLTIAALKCARSSSTKQQEDHAIAVLRLTLRVQRGAVDPISHGVLLLHLSEFCKRQEDGESESSIIEAFQHLTAACERPTDPDFCRLRTQPVDLTRSLYLLLISEAQDFTPMHTSFLTSYISAYVITPASQWVAQYIKSHGVSKVLLKWCADVIANKAGYLDHFASILMGEALTMKKCMRRLLFCCCFQVWLKDTKRGTGFGRYFSEAESALKKSEMPWPEALSAISFIIVDEAFRGFDPLSTSKRWSSTRALTPHLIRAIRRMLGRINETDQAYADKFLAFVVVSRYDRKSSQVDELSRKVLQVFAGNIVSSGILLDVLQDSPWSELTPTADDLQEYIVRPSPSARMLYTPCSSFSSGARSLRALHAELDRISMTSLRTSKTKDSSRAAWSLSRRSSWSFGMITGFGRDSSLLECEDVPGDDSGIFPEITEDIIMVDV